MSPLKPMFWLLLLLVLLLGCINIETRYVPGIPHFCLKPRPVSIGICTIEIEGFYYDPATLDCERYSISACHLTPGQSFGSQQDCVATCVRGQRRSPDYYRNE
ncbi:kunitz-type serine protease inhibitor spermatin [Drosophila grimshawi]|uniref:GH13175 n=1 Tax=Drosophila grimshawi TaxID=7222 RepID=B4JQI9_DROGR|nr:kunitz-type serine protease inhibitor spermatin [Drosophila grimshawi]EDV99169.1 GH13175 [Drosophila grimshawi]